MKVTPYESSLHESNGLVTTAKGSIGVEVYQGKLRLRIPPEYCQGKQKVIYTQQPDNNFGWRKAKQMAWQIEEDIAKGVFAPTLGKYKPSSRFTPLVVEHLSLLELWDKYCEYRKPQLSVTHFEENYLKRYRNAIISLPTQSLADGAYCILTTTGGSLDVRI